MAFTGTVTDYFAQLSGETFPGVGGVALFALGGDGGGDFVFDLATGARLSGDTQPELILRARARDFLALVEGRMSAAEGMLTERLVVSGDAARVSRLVRVLEDAHTGLRQK